MPALFISYRRSDSSDITGRIFDRLVGHFGNKPVKVLRDVDSIPVGEDFREVLRDRIKDCDVVLVVIGPTWANVKDGKGVRRIDDAADTVRIEIEQALELKKKVIPVCVTHAPMPTEEDLPEAIKKLAFRNGVQVRPDPDFNNDIGRLIGALDKIFKEKQIAEAKPPTLPPPQRNFHIPEPPPPPTIDTRRSTGAHGTDPGSPFASNPKNVPIQAQTVEAPPSPPRRSDSSPGVHPHPAFSSPFAPPPPPGMAGPMVRPLPSDKPKLAKGIMSSAGIGLLMLGVASLCLCGGSFVYFCMSMAGKSYERELKTDIQNHPAIKEHLGEIITVKWEAGALGLPSGPGGEASDLFTVSGTKKTAEVIGHTEGFAGEMKGDILRLPDGQEISLHGSYTPLSPSP